MTAQQKTSVGQYHDGKSAAPHSVTVHFGTASLTIVISGQDMEWPYTRLALVQKSDAMIRLTCRDTPEAVLVLPAASGAILYKTVPDVMTGRKERRYMRRLVLGLVAGSVFVCGFCFWGLPLLVEPLARVMPKSFEIQMGRNMASQIQLVFRPCPEQDAAIAAITPMLEDMATAGEVGFPITLHYVNVAQPNAFALPGGQVMVTQGLLQALENDPEALLAVLAHELGHVRTRDGIQAFYRNIGVILLVEAITGGSGLAQQGILLGGQLAEFGHSRTHEARADDTAIAILLRVGLDPAALGRAFKQITGAVDDGANRDVDQHMSDEDGNRTWHGSLGDFLKTHPNTPERIARASAHATPTTRELFSPQDWQTITSACSTRVE